MLCVGDGERMRESLRVDEPRLYSVRISQMTRLSVLDKIPHNVYPCWEIVIYKENFQKKKKLPHATVE